MTTLTIKENGKERVFELIHPKQIKKLKEWIEEFVDYKEIKPEQETNCDYFHETNKEKCAGCIHYHEEQDQPKEIVNLVCSKCKKMVEVKKGCHPYIICKDHKKQDFPIVFENEQMKIEIRGIDIEDIWLYDKSILAHSLFLDNNLDLLIKAIDKWKEMRE